MTEAAKTVVDFLMGPAGAAAFVSMLLSVSLTVLLAAAGYVVPVSAELRRFVNIAAVALSGPFFLWLATFWVVGALIASPNGIWQTAVILFHAVVAVALFVVWIQAARR